MNEFDESRKMSPFTTITRHRRLLDDSLISIKGHTEESKQARTFIIGQIEALDFVIRLLE